VLTGAKPIAPGNSGVLAKGKVASGNSGVLARSGPTAGNSGVLARGATPVPAKAPGVPTTTPSGAPATMRGIVPPDITQPMPPSAAPDALLFTIPPEVDRYIPLVLLLLLGLAIFVLIVGV
jgi:hypothetical protein